MTLPYEEGTLFAIPLRNIGFGIGLVARTTTKGKVVLVYLFRQRYTTVPPLNLVSKASPSEACKVIRSGDLALIDGTWPIIGKLIDWDRSEWSMPLFIRRDELSRRAWEVRYSDDDPNKVEAEYPVSYENEKLERDSVFGSGAVEIVLTKLLGMIS